MEYFNGIFSSSDDDKTLPSVATVDFPNVDYDKAVTPLYEGIEEQAWMQVNHFLYSGYWPNALFLDPKSPEEQACTWVTRYNRTKEDKNLRWSQLPLHAAIIFGAPPEIIEQLLEICPKAARCTDDRRMLPLHLAFRHASPDCVICMLLDVFPEALTVRARKGLLPVECAAKSPNPDRGTIIADILKRNSSIYEKKRAAKHLKDLFKVKEATKIKTKKIDSLTASMEAMKDRTEKTEKQLQESLKFLKDLEDLDALTKPVSKEKMDERNRLVGILKDLQTKEEKTKGRLESSILELEALENKKPTSLEEKEVKELETVATEEPEREYSLSAAPTVDAELEITHTRSTLTSHDVTDMIDDPREEEDEPKDKFSPILDAFVNSVSNFALRLADDAIPGVSVGKSADESIEDRDEAADDEVSVKTDVEEEAKEEATDEETRENPDEIQQVPSDIKPLSSWRSIGSKRSMVLESRGSHNPTQAVDSAKLQHPTPTDLPAETAQS